MSGFRDALSSHREALNLLNVYPVPDGDTGTNMSMTVESVVAAFDGLADDAELAEVTGAVAHGSLMGARGNSGVILSQVLRALSGVIGVVSTARSSPTVWSRRPRPPTGRS